MDLELIFIYQFRNYNKILGRFFIMKSIICLTFVLALVYNMNSQIIWEGYYNVGDECSSILCQREDHNF